jgi:hypothetical protein
MINSFLSFIIDVFLWILPFPLIFFLGRFAWRLWLHYIQNKFISGIKWTLLEIVPPRDVLRSPKSMELFLTNALYHWSIKGGLEQYWQGAVWFWFSLEIASIDGQVHFYVRTPSRIKDLVETQMYAQFPQAQVKEVEDYTLAVDEISYKSDWNFWGCHFKLEKPEAYPIKTYVDFGLDKDPKEEYKVDPLSPLIELFGSISKGEQMWFQIIVRPTKKKFHTKGTWFGTHDWVKESQEQIKKLLKPFTSIKEEGARIETRVPDFLKPEVTGMSNKISKIGFDVGIRACYLAKKEIFPIGTRTNNSRNIRLILRQFSNPNLNSFSRHNSTQADAYNGYFLISAKTITLLANRMLNKYRARSFFHPKMREKIFSMKNIFWPFSSFIKAYVKSSIFVLNIEEIATLWHFPGQILKVPTLERIESKEAAPPTNLPE